MKNCREHVTSHLLHFSISWEGFGNGMKTFFPDSSTSLKDLGNDSRYCESVFHLPQQQCLVIAILLWFWDKHYILTDFPHTLSVKNSETWQTPLSDMQSFVWVTRGVRSIFRICVQRSWRFSRTFVCFNIHALFSKQVMRILKLIRYELLSWASQHQILITT